MTGRGMVTTRRPALLLGRPNTATHQAKDLHHLDRRAQCQDPVPAQAEQLATAKASVGAEQHEGPVPFVDRLCELEHLVLCQYLFAAFSLKQTEREALSPEQVELIKRWRHSLMDIAEQEMLHLALVQNLLTAVGAAPRLARPNFPVPPRSFPAAENTYAMKK